MCNFTIYILKWAAIIFVTFGRPPPPDLLLLPPIPPTRKFSGPAPAPAAPHGALPKFSLHFPLGVGGGRTFFIEVSNYLASSVISMWVVRMTWCSITELSLHGSRPHREDVHSKVSTYLDLDPFCAFEDHHLQVVPAASIPHMTKPFSCATTKIWLNLTSKVTI